MRHHNSVMAKKKPTDRHKKNTMARIRERLAEQLRILADERDTSFTEEANRAIREMLERENRWPPTKSSKPSEDS